MPEETLSVYMAVPSTIKEVLYTQLETACEMAEAKPTQANRTLPAEEYWRDVRRLIKDAHVILADLSPIHKTADEGPGLADPNALTEACYARFGAKKSIIALCAGEAKHLPIGWQKFPCVFFEPSPKGYMTLAKNIGRMVLSEIIEELDRRDNAPPELPDVASIDDLLADDSPTASARSEQRLKSLTDSKMGSAKDKELKDMLRARFLERMKAEQSGDAPPPVEPAAKVVGPRAPGAAAGLPGGGGGPVVTGAAAHRQTTPVGGSVYGISGAVEKGKLLRDDEPKSRLLQLQEKFKKKQEAQVKVEQKEQAKKDLPATIQGLTDEQIQERKERQGKGRLIDKKVSKINELNELPYQIGRVPGCHIVIPSEAVSKYHVKITQQNGTFLIEDGGSANGTFINGRRVTQRTAIYDGDVLTVAITAEAPKGIREFIFRQDAE